MSVWDFVLGLVIGLILVMVCLAACYVTVEPPKPEPPTRLTEVDT